MESLAEKFENFSFKETSVGNFTLKERNLTFRRATLHPVARNSAENRERRYQWVQTTDMNFLESCVFVDKAGFNINMRSPNARPLKDIPAVVKTPSTRAISHTILGAITAHDVTSIEIREPLKPKTVKVNGGRKRKKPLGKPLRKGTGTGHYVKFAEMTNLYIIPQIVSSLIEMRGYRAMCLPSYSPKLNSTENFWSVVKNLVKRSEFTETENLKTRIAKASESVSRKTLDNIADHSVNNFKNTLIKNQSS